MYTASIADFTERDPPMRIARTVAVLLFAALLTQLARPALAAAPLQEPPLDEATLGNLTYPTEYVEAGEVTLTDGVFEDVDARVNVMLAQELTAYGDLDGDGDTDAVVVLVSNTGGSGVFHDLYALLDQAGEAVPSQPSFLGDRVQIASISVEEEGAVVLAMMTQGPDDPMCCATLAVEQTWLLEDGALQLVDEVELVAGGDESEAAENALEAWDPAAAPRTATLTLGGSDGAWLDPALVSVFSGVTAGAEKVDAALLGIGCAGVVPATPDVVVEWTADERVDALRFFILSVGDPSLVVVTPSGEILCNDDLNPLMLDPMIEVPSPEEGRYAIYVGVFETQATFPGILVVTGLPLDPATFELGSLLPDRGVDPRAIPLELPLETLTLDDGPDYLEISAEDVPVAVDIVAGGEIPVFDVDLGNPLCTGFVAAEPTLRFSWDGEVEGLTLFVEAEQDTTLIVRDPNAAFQCADDTDGGANLNPSLALPSIPGAYEVWVGSFSPDTLVEGTLTIGGDPSVLPAPLSAE
jgi:hypothetical protein